MPDYGLLTTGFVPQTSTVIREEINDSLRTAFGPSLDLSDGSVIGQIVGILAERYALLWELAEAVNASQDPDGATGTSLDAVCALTGTVRDPAVASTVELTATGTPGTIITIGSRASVVSTGVEFEATEGCVIAALTAWASTTAYVLGDQRTNGGNAYVVTVAGTSAGSGGPTGETDAEVDGTVTWRYMGAGTGAVAFDAQAVETGPTVAVSGAITEIETPISGWEGVINLLDATVGNDEETDESLRAKREDELAAAGSGTTNAIRAALLQLTGVTAVTVFMNNTDTTDGDGIPPHAIEALVLGGEDQDIFDALLFGDAAVAAGIATHGTESGSSTDTSGNTYTMKFSRPDEIEIYIDVTLTYDDGDYPDDGDDQVKAALVAYGDTLATGRDAVASQLSARVFGVAGVLDVTAFLLDDAPAPATSTTVAISLRQLATFDTSRITVNSSAATP